MKTNFANAKHLVEEMSRNLHDQTLPVGEMSFNNLESMNISGQEVEVLPSAQSLFASRLRVPFSYLVRCSHDLQAYNLNYWLEHEKKERETLFCRFDGLSLRAVFTDRYKVMDNREIVEKMDQYGFSPDTEVHLNFNQNLMVMKIPDYSRSFSINGDNMTPGIAISNSEVGILAFNIEAYFYRLVCTNGLISKTAVSSKFRHVSYKALDEFDSIVGRVAFESQRNQGKLAISMEKAVDDPLATLASFHRQFKLTKREAEAVDRAFQLERGSTMFQVINAYTRGAQDNELSEEESHKLERVGGQILALIR